MSDSVVVMVTVSERLAQLNRFLETLHEHEPSRHIFVHMQGDDLRDQIQWPAGMVFEAMHTPERLGCHAARVLALRHPGVIDSGYTSFINVDDDVELIEQTDWQPAVDKALEPGVGFVLTGWVRSEAALPKALGIMHPEFIKQVMVYQGGGMAYDRELAGLMASLDPVPARFDDIWPLEAYLGGRVNYRYRGSLAIHRIQGKGGMKAYMDAEPRPLLCEKWINYRYIQGARVAVNVCIPMDSDLKPKAREMHREMRAMRGWK